MPSGSQVPSGPFDLREGQAQQQPQQEADEQAEHGRHELGGRQVLDASDQPARRHHRQVREQREADDRPGDRPCGEDEPGIAQLGEQAGAGCGDTEPDQGAKRRAEDPDASDHAGSASLQRGVAPARRAGSAEPSTRRRAPTTGRTGRPRPRQPSPRPATTGVSTSAIRTASARDATSTISIPGHRRVLTAAGTRHDRPREPQPRGFAQPPIEPADRPQLTEQAHLADRDGARDDRPVAEGRGEREGERQVEARLGDRQPAGEVRVDVVAAEAGPGAAAQHRDQQRQPVGIHARRRAARRRRGGRGDEGLHLHEQRPGALEDRRDDRARRGPVVIGQERPARVGDLEQAALAHLEHADLLGRPVPVLRPAEQAQAAGPVPLDGQDDVDEVLQRLGPRQGAVLGHVAHEHDRDGLALRELHEAQRRLAHLADRARRPVELLGGDGLDRVHDQQPGPGATGELGDPADAGLGDDTDRVAHGPVREPEPAGPELDL